ncbi:hypothetical protein SASPL_145458 [Salvia splendens]|uniref:Uncharacterized protein n=1 Tax=Salvia splendens TaxID=180675 RepID=A0A8X8WH30_SALSN|nr:hypothetical protein SASPL_145458 [Salvia splendens]
MKNSVAAKMGDEEIQGNISDHLSTGKRQSPLSRSILQESLPKRPTLNPSSDHDHFGYKKLSLSQYFTPAPLRRTISEPIYSPGTTNSAAAPTRSSEIPNSPAPVNAGQEIVPSLHRTMSAPIPVFAATPPRPFAGRKPSRSPTRGENPSAKACFFQLGQRLKRMKERLKVMSEWWNQVASEDGDEENLESENDNDPKLCFVFDTALSSVNSVFGPCEMDLGIGGVTLQEECEGEAEIPSQEAVFVEKSGESLVLHFKCPCGDGYQILLSGNNCYYKLTNFRNN